MKPFTPAVIWFTGLSGAGKSTIASAVDVTLRAWGIPTELLDGDAIRAIAPTGLDRADRARTSDVSVSWPAGSSITV